MLEPELVASIKELKVNIYIIKRFYNYNLIYLDNSL